MQTDIFDKTITGMPVQNNSNSIEQLFIYIISQYNQKLCKTSRSKASNLRYKDWK